MAAKMDDYIHISQLEVSAHVGVPDDERASTQRLILNITFWPANQAALEDKIGRTVDYAEVCAEVRRFVQARADRLIETLAEALAKRLLETFAIEKVTIELRKFILPGVDFVSVTMTRERPSE